MIEKLKLLFNLSFLFLGLVACQLFEPPVFVPPAPPVPRVISERTIFHNLGAAQKGSVFLLGYPQKKNESLEFAHYRAIIEKKFLLNGYQVVTDQDASDFTVFVSYGIDGGETRTHTESRPILGLTGGGYTTHRGSVNSYGSYGNYSGYSYTSPRLGVVGSSTHSYDTTTYTRILWVDMVKTQSLKLGKIEKVFEGRIKSLGSFGNINMVLPSMLEAMFCEFPGSNAETRKIEIPTGEKIVSCPKPRNR